MTKIFESEFFFGGKSNREMPRKTPVRIVLVVTSSNGSVRVSYLLSSLESAVVHHHYCFPADSNFDSNTYGL